MSGVSSKKTNSYEKDSFDDDKDSLIEAEELDLDDDSIFEDDEIIAAALDYYDSNFKLSNLLKSKDRRNNVNKVEDEEQEEGEEEDDEEEEEEEDLNKITQPELPEMNFDDIDLEPKHGRPCSGKSLCEEIEEPDVEAQVSDNETDDNRNERLSNRSKSNRSVTNSIDIEISSRRPSSFYSDSRYSFSFDGRASSTSIPSNIPKKTKSRLNLTFSNDRVREIDRHNKILLNKILTKKPTIEVNKRPNNNNNNNNNFNKPVNNSFLYNRQSSAAINRKKEQSKIDYENQILKRKLEAIAVGKRKNKNRFS